MTTVKNTFRKPAIVVVEKHLARDRFPQAPKGSADYLLQLVWGVVGSSSYPVLADGVL